MRKTYFIRLAVAATAVAVMASTTLPAQAAVKPADKATVGDDCTAASAKTNKVAKGRGVEGSDLTCMVVPTGSYKGQTKWWYKDVAIDELDGLTVNGDTWWFNLRPSNTEPLLRLNVEASTQAQMESLRDAVLSLIRG